VRILLYTGKGGVGKTSLSAATALHCAERGLRTIVLSTDPAHSLGDSFDMALGSEPLAIGPNLWGQEIDLLHQMDRHWGTVQDYISALFAWRGMDDLVAEETAVLPGMEELASLMQITYLAESGDYDVIVVDCAPTGATLQLLALPDLARWYLDRIFPWEKKVLKAAAPVIRRMTDMPMPTDALYDSAEDLLRQLERISRLLTDPQLTSVRLVLNPEKMVIKEAQRAYTYLNLYGYATDAVFCNRMIPAGVTDAYFTAWKEAQARYLVMVEEAFDPLPVMSIPLFDQEVVGLDMLRRMAEATYDERVDPTAIFFVGKPQEVTKENGVYKLSLPLPLVERNQIRLSRSMADELIIHIGNWKRNLSLPRTLSGRPVIGAKYEGDRLVVLFDSAANGQSEAAG
jgi:arsenite-transporting ATPase